ncbi:MAG TPA: hypothetical protein VKQ29_00160 [Aliidongia sp.]|nr:hypothetical protein [Aliidongia sp.]
MPVESIARHPMQRRRGLGPRSETDRKYDGAGMHPRWRLPLDVQAVSGRILKSEGRKTRRLAGDWTDVSDNEQNTRLRHAVECPALVIEPDRKLALALRQGRHDSRRWGLGHRGQHCSDYEGDTHEKKSQDCGVEGKGRCWFQPLTLDLASPRIQPTFTPFPPTSLGFVADHARQALLGDAKTAA